jgi:hypothetical protein
MRIYYSNPSACHHSWMRCRIEALKREAMRSSTDVSPETTLINSGMQGKNKLLTT